MIQIEPRWFGRPATRPGYGEPEPLKPVSTMDSPENVAICLRCPVAGGCDTTTKACPLYGQSAAAKRKRRRQGAERS